MKEKTNGKRHETELNGKEGRNNERRERNSFKMISINRRKSSDFGQTNPLIRGDFLTQMKGAEES